MFSILSLQVIAEAQGMTGKYRRGGYVKKKEDGFSGHVKEKGRGLGISAIFIKKNTKTSQKLVFGVVNNYFS
ncbi:hypothetical protein NWT87_27155 (plasmid) [Klebsiella pneumoniae]|uniref:hypothetical protein n=1 Tax=Klebsiella pneumoniae complex TaxID=3390273 RepID=UPI00111980D4|nr:MULTISPECIES: hypothetical protein [Klebsiella]EKX8699394.1 hypothetical protein [Escherichia coli]MBC3838559.1 hypothetical protein [Klebsiella pneumoniae]MCJ7358826.1 hypothetical protein [Klebsiella pneumoniae]MCS6410787.1 hypothetical protein [Klebsiella pneumoniae]MEB5780456.1 hypothetical protein [Klebsiella pneumoniae]